MNLLKEVIKNCNVGVDAIDNIWENVKDTKLRETIWKQKVKIMDLSDRASKELGDEPSAKDGTYPNKMERAMMKAAVKMKSGLDKSTTNIAEMLIEGNNMGINSVAGSLKDLVLNYLVIFLLHFSLLQFYPFCNKFQFYVKSTELFFLPSLS